MSVQQRKTWQRSAVLDALTAHGGFVSAQDLHRTLEDEGTAVGVATVYRALNRLAADGVADVYVDEQGQQLFRACGMEQHHHHLICRRCGAAHDITDANLEGWANEIAGRYGFTQVTHHVTVLGLCAECTAELAELQDLRR